MRGPRNMSSFHEEKVTTINTGIAAGSAVMYELTLNDWVLIATLLYFLLQIGLLIPRYVTMYRDWKNKKDT